MGKKLRRNKATIHYPDMEKITVVVYQGKKNSRCRSPGKEKAVDHLGKEKVVDHPSKEKALDHPGKEKVVDHPNSKVWLNFTLHEPSF